MLPFHWNTHRSIFLPRLLYVVDLTHSHDLHRICVIFHKSIPQVLSYFIIRDAIREDVIVLKSCFLTDFEEIQHLFWRKCRLRSIIHRYVYCFFTDDIQILHFVNIQEHRINGCVHRLLPIFVLPVSSSLLQIFIKMLERQLLICCWCGLLTVMNLCITVYYYHTHYLFHIVLVAGKRAIGEV